MTASFLPLAPIALILALLPGEALAETRGTPEQRGETLAQSLCARCHAIGAERESPHAEAPPFRDIVTLYPVEHLAEALSEGIEVGHPDMPVFEFSASAVEDLLAYFSTLAE